MMILGLEISPDPLCCSVLGPPNDLFDLKIDLIVDSGWSDDYPLFNEKRNKAT